MSKYLKDKKVYYTANEHGFYDAPEHCYLTLKSVAVSFVDDNGELRVFTSATPIHMWQGDTVEVFNILVRNGFVPKKCYTVADVSEVLEKQNITLVERKKEND